MIIMTDTPSMYSPQEERERGLVVIPACTIIDGKVYRDYADISSEDFLDKVRSGAVASSTQPSIGEILEVYEENDDEILVLPIGYGLSGTYQNMLGARNLVENKERIHVLDTRTLAGPQRYLVEKAIALRDKGLSIENIKARLQESIESSFSCVIPCDFDFLKRSGRLTPFAAKLGSAMKIVPVMTQTEDMKKITRFCIKPTKRGALKAVIQHLGKLGIGGEHLITVSHGGVEEEALSVLDTLRESFQTAKTALYSLPPSLVCHGGPGCILIQTIRL